MKPSMRAKILQSRLLPILTFPYRAKLVGLYLLHAVKNSIPWLITSREFANFTYDLDEINKLYLVNFIANVTGASLHEIEGYINEIEHNQQLDSYIDNRLRLFKRGREIDDKAYYGRRIGWYALIRAKRPEIVVETGTEKGLGSLVIAEALRMNKVGKLFTLDVEPSAGLLIGPEYDGLIERRIGNSLQLIEQIPEIDFFIHDSDHSAEHERAELNAAHPSLTESAIVLSDNSHVTSELAIWAAHHSMKFLYFAEKPIRHWYPGAGIGVAFKG